MGVLLRIWRLEVMGLSDLQVLNLLRNECERQLIKQIQNLKQNLKYQYFKYFLLYSTTIFIKEFLIIIFQTFKFELMNINGNNESKDCENLTQNFSVNGNYNKLQLTCCNSRITVSGNQNILSLFGSKGQIIVNGNGNIIKGISSQIMIGINGNGNQLQDDDCKITLMHANGFGNVIPQSAKKIQPQSSRKYKPQVQLQKKQYKRIQPKHKTQVPQIPMEYPNSRRFQPPPVYYNRRAQEMRNGFNYRQGRNDLMYRNYEPPRHRNPQINFIPQRQPFRVEIEENTEGLNKKELGMIPITKHEGKEHNCTICLEDVRVGDKVTFLFCFHSFHSDCVIGWLKKCSTCPICQISVRKHMKE